MSGLRSMESNHKPLTVLRSKVLIVGDACVGKTALTQVFNSSGTVYPKNYLMTIGAEFTVKALPIPDTNVIVELYMYDCSGQSIFNQLDMNAKYYENASAVMVVFSIGSKESLQSCTKWLQSVRQSKQGGGPGITAVLVGNKCEFRDGSEESRAEVSKQEAQQLANQLGMQYFEASASSNVGVEEPFKHIAQEFYQHYQENIQRTNDLANNLMF